MKRCSSGLLLKISLRRWLIFYSSLSKLLRTLRQGKYKQLPLSELLSSPAVMLSLDIEFLSIFLNSVPLEALIAFVDILFFLNIRPNIVFLFCPKWSLSSRVRFLTYEALILNSSTYNQRFFRNLDLAVVHFKNMGLSKKY